MSLHIYISHNGDHLLADPVSFASYVPVHSHASRTYPLGSGHPCLCRHESCILVGMETNLHNLRSARMHFGHGLPAIRRYRLKGKY